MQKLILASASPQRKRLLQGLELDFTVIPSNFNEAEYVESDAAQRAQHLARLKAQDVAQGDPDAFVIGCDTLVVSPLGELYEKPETPADAERMLRSYNGKACTVHSGLCIVAPGGKTFEGVSSSSVHFKKLTDTDLAWWISTGLWQDRSGAFQIDGPGQLLIEHLEGDWSSVVGLPVFLLGKLLEESGYPTSSVNG